MNWLRRWRRLRARGILGMNARNARCVLDLNPRSRFPRVDGKRQTRDLCLRIGVPTPALYAVLTAHSALRHLPRLLAGRSDFVLKPNRGAAGRGVLVIPGRDGEGFLRADGRRLELADLRQHVSAVLSGLFSLGGHPDEALLQQRVVAHPDLARISFQGTADVRVIVYKSAPVMAMLRLPTRRSGGRANLHQGAVGAGVDVASGVTVRAVLGNCPVECHPDTGEAVVGCRVPYWADILDMARRVSAAVELGYVGVDIVLDHREGPLLLEVNARPGLAIQLANGRGLLPLFDAIDRGQSVHG